MFLEPNLQPSALYTADSQQMFANGLINATQNWTIM